MGKPKYDSPTNTFPYRISKRLNVMSVPRKNFTDEEYLPALTPRGVRQSALKGRVSDRINDSAWPYLRRLLAIKRQYKNLFSAERTARVERMIEAANMTTYSKLANCTIDLKRPDSKKKKAWSESEWKKHMEYINQICKPKKEFQVPPVNRGPGKPLDELLPRINEISVMPSFKVCRRLSKEEWYRNPIKVAPGALKYVISERVKKLAAPRAIPQPE